MNPEIELDKIARKDFNNYMYAELEESEKRYKKSLRSFIGE